MHFLDIDEDIFLDDLYPLLSDKDLYILSQVSKLFRRSSLLTLLSRHNITESDASGGVITTHTDEALLAIARSQSILTNTAELRVNCTTVHSLAAFLLLRTTPVPFVDILFNGPTRRILLECNMDGLFDALIPEGKVAVIEKSAAKICEPVSMFDRERHLFPAPPQEASRWIPTPYGIFLALTSMVSWYFAAPTSPSEPVSPSPLLPKRISPHVPAGRFQVTRILRVGDVPLIMFNCNTLTHLRISTSITTLGLHFPFHHVSIPQLKSIEIDTETELEFDIFAAFMARHETVEEVKLGPASITDGESTTSLPWGANIKRILAPVRIMALILESYGSSMLALESICLGSFPTAVIEYVHLTQLTEVLDYLAAIPKHSSVTLTLSLPDDGRRFHHWLQTEMPIVSCVTRLRLCSSTTNERWDRSITPLLPPWIGSTFPNIQSLAFADCVCLFKNEIEEAAFERSIVECGCAKLAVGLGVDGSAGTTIMNINGHREEDGLVEQIFDDWDSWPRYRDMFSAF